MQCFVKASKPVNCYTTIQLQILTFKLFSAKIVKFLKSAYMNHKTILRKKDS